MKSGNNYILALFFAFSGLFSQTACAIDSPDTPDLISLFEKREKPFIILLQKPSTNTRETIRAYHNYKIFLDKELNKAYKTLKTNLTTERQKELTVSQRNWIKFRDAEFEFINNNWVRSSFGSSFALSRGDYSSGLIRNRIIQLLKYAVNY